MIHGRVEWSGEDPHVVRHTRICSGGADERSVQLRLLDGNGRRCEPFDLHVPVADVEAMIAELRRAQAWVATGEEP